MKNKASQWRQILQFWFGDDLEREWPEPAFEARWFGGGPALDKEVTERFGAPVEVALEGGLTDWEGSAYSRLALILLLDQFSRNVFRGSARAFAGDARAVALVKDGLALNMDGELPWACRAFFYMPLMHAEDEALQARCMACFEQAAETAPPAVAEKLRSNLKFARLHAEIIERFGRFPHRNTVLGRESSEEERVFLENGPRFGQ